MLTFLAENVIFFLSSLAIVAGLVFVSTTNPAAPAAPATETTSVNAPTNTIAPTETTPVPPTNTTVAAPATQSTVTPPAPAPRPTIRREDDERIDD